MKGRKADHPEIAALKGNPGKRQPRAPAAVKPISVGGAKPPRWLSKSRAAVTVWNEIVPLLQRINAFDPLYEKPLSRYCRYVADWLVADAAVLKEGSWYDGIGTNGEPTKKRHPAFQARVDLEKMLSQIEASFGMRPDKRYEMLRNQAAIPGAGDLFGARAPEKPAMATERVVDDDIIGSASRFDSAPPRLQ